MSRRKQTTPNKVHCEYDVMQHCGTLALAGLWSEVGRSGMMGVMGRDSLWGMVVTHLLSWGVKEEKLSSVHPGSWLCPGIAEQG